ncbi:MAG: DUF1653 domain-containing protein [Gallionellaceae bacterium]
MWYQHYKGSRYELVCEAKLESDPAVILVIYRSEEGLVWARPREIFFEKVVHDNRLVDRFKKLD